MPENTNDPVKEVEELLAGAIRDGVSFYEAGLVAKAMSLARQLRDAREDALTPFEAEEAAKAIRNGMTPSGGIYIPKSWNIILRKLDAAALPATNAAPSDNAEKGKL